MTDASSPPPSSSREVEGLRRRLPELVDRCDRLLDVTKAENAAFRQGLSKLAAAVERLHLDNAEFISEFAAQADGTLDVVEEYQKIQEQNARIKAKLWWGICRWVYYPGLESSDVDLPMVRERCVDYLDPVTLGRCWATSKLFLGVQQCRQSILPGLHFFRRIVCVATFHLSCRGKKKF